MNKSHIYLCLSLTVLSILIVGFAITGCSDSKSSVVGQNQAGIDKSQINDTAEPKTPDTSSQPNPVTESSKPESESQQTKLADFKALNQAPELGTGCEITSLAALLNFYNFPADKCELSDNYLKKGPVGSTDPNIAFVGNPRDSSSYGCFSPVLTETANAYLRAQGADVSALDISGNQFSELFQYIDQGVPVIVWGTRYCEVGHYSVTWNVNGTNITWFTPEHCMVLVGYNTVASTVSVADPLEGAVVEYDLNTFESRYNDLRKQAIIIQ